jgi:hypothetical protein
MGTVVLDDSPVRELGRAWLGRVRLALFVGLR